MTLTRHYAQNRYSPAGEAKAHEQKRLAEEATEVKNKQIPAFMFQGFGFRPQYRVFRAGNIQLEGPLCPREDTNDIPCLSELSGELDKTNVKCDVCGFSAVLPQPFQRFREIAHKKYEGYMRYVESGGKIVTLDVPYDAIKAKDQDDTREIKIKWSQKDGRNMALIYFIEKDMDGKKTQVFVDMDREEVRYDSSDIPPGKVLAFIKAVFPKTKVEITYNKDCESGTS